MNQNKAKSPLNNIKVASQLSQLAEPPSPTVSTSSFMSSVSWMAEKSASDLIPMLKNAYHTLKDRERDLVLAAEIGKSLLENNIAMKNKYEQLLNNTRSPSLLTDNGVAAALPTPSSSNLTNNRRQESDDDENDDDDYTGTMRYVSSKSTREAMIEALEMKNEELNEHLDAILQEQASMDKSNTKKHRQLEQEINRLNTSLEMATTKIQELEDMNKKTKGRRPPPPDDNVDRHMIDDLLDQIDQLKTQNDTTIQSKQDLETKLANTLQDLRRLREQFEQFQFTKDDHEDLKAAYERQFRHIDELNASVEEHRSMLQKLQERGVPDEPKNTLFGEGMKQRPHHLQPSYSTPTHHAPSPVPCMKPSLSSTTLLSDLAGTTDMRLVLARAAGVDQKTLEDAIRFVDCLEGGEPSWEEDQQWMTMFDPAFPRDGLYPALATSNSNSNKELMVYPTTLNGRIQNTVRHFFKAVWRWCRFAAILTTAILISLWNGPDYMLLENY